MQAHGQPSAAPSWATAQLPGLGAADEDDVPAASATTELKKGPCGHQLTGDRLFEACLWMTTTGKALRHAHTPPRPLTSWTTGGEDARVSVPTNKITKTCVSRVNKLLKSPGCERCVPRDFPASAFPGTALHDVRALADQCLLELSNVSRVLVECVRAKGLLPASASMQAENKSKSLRPGGREG